MCSPRVYTTAFCSRYLKRWISGGGGGGGGTLVINVRCVQEISAILPNATRYTCLFILFYVFTLFFLLLFFLFFFRPHLQCVYTTALVPGDVPLALLLWIHAKVCAPICRQNLIKVHGREIKRTRRRDGKNRKPYTEKRLFFVKKKKKSNALHIIF